MIRVVLAALAAMSIFATTKAEAKSDDRPAASCAEAFCGGWFQPEFRKASGKRAERHRTRHAAAKVHRTRHLKTAATPGILAMGAFSRPEAHIHPRIVAHPAGCPSARFCGCGLCVRYFGKPCVAGGLALARSWLGFARAPLAPGMAVVERGGAHVFEVLEVRSPRLVLAYDPNSGGHQTRIHLRRLSASAVVVNPRSGRLAARHRSHRV